MPRYALGLEYDGRSFAGTQTQSTGLRTLQQVCNEAIQALSGEPITVRLSSRLDAGVSATALVADVWLSRTWALPALGMALTQRLPPDVAVRRVAVVADDWHSTYQAREKTYVYHVCRRTMRPVLQPRVWWVRQMDHPERLDDAAALLPGTHDLSGFACLRHDDSDQLTGVRTVLSANWRHEILAGEEHHYFTIRGQGFLYKQIRGFVGAMVFLAQNNITFAQFAAVVAQGRGAPRLGNIAPPDGLTLCDTLFHDEPAWCWL